MLDPVFPSFDLTGRRALVTGASRGIGQALAVGLARFGADVAVCARDPSALKGTKAAIEETGNTAHAFPLDVRDVDAIAPAFAAAADRLGSLDILIANAGIEQVAPALDVTAELWDRIVDTNLKGAFFCAQAGAFLMRGRGGAILTLCSLTSEVGVPTAVPYGSSKSGVAGMTRALATEWAPLGIRVNGLGPGYFRTDMTEPFYRDDAWQRAMLAKLPAGRFGALDDLIGAAVFLCSDAARYVTGQVLYVDGGYLASI